MADVQVDELSIKLSSTLDTNLVTNLKSITDSLSKLQSVLGSFNGNTGSITGISNIATEFKKFSNELKGADLDGAKKAAEALSLVSGAMSKLGGRNATNGIGNMSAIGTQANKLMSNLSAAVANPPDLQILTDTAKAIGKFNNKGPTGASKNLPSLANGIKDLTDAVADGNSKMADLSGLTNLTSAISKLGGKSATEAIGNIPRISGALKVAMGSFSQLPTLDTNMISGLGSLVESVRKFSGKSAQNAIPLLPQFGAAVKQLLNDVASAPPIDPSVAKTIHGLGNLNAQAIKGLIQLSKESEKSAKSVNLLGKAFKGVTGTAKGFVGAIGKGISALGNLRNHTTNLGQTGFAQLTKSIVMVRTALWGLRRVASLFTSSINLASDLVEVNNVIDHVFGNYTMKVEELAKSSIRNFGISELTFKRYAGQFQAMASTMGITDDMVSNATQKLQEMGKAVDANGKYAYEYNGKMQDMATSITEWVADIASFYDMDYAEAATKAQSIFSGTTRPLRSIGVDLTQANLKAWALANGLNADIENMTQAEKATLRFQYALAATSVATGDFQRTAGRMCAA